MKSRLCALIFSFLLLVPLFLVGFLGFTQIGLQFLVCSAETILGEQLRIEEVNGRLLGDWSVVGLVFESPTILISLDDISCRWQPKALLKKKLYLQDISARKLLVKVKVSEEKEEKKEASHTSVVLPFNCVLDQLKVVDSSLEFENGAQNIDLDVVLLRLHTVNQQIDVDELEVSSNNAVARLEGSLKLENMMRWTAHLQLTDVDPSQFVGGVPGNIDAEVESKGSLQNEIWQGTLELKRLQGDLQGYPLSSSGKVEFSDTTYTISSFQLANGANTFQLEGRVNKTFDVQFALSLPEIGALIPTAAGEAGLQGTLTGDLTQPLLEAAFQGKNLFFGDRGVEKVIGHASAQLKEDGKGVAGITLSEIHQGESLFPESVLRVEGTLQQHTLRVDLAPELGDLDLLLTGGLLGEEWRGRLETFNVSYPSEKTWSLESGASLVVSPEVISATNLCLKQDSEKMCLEGSWQAGKRWDGGVIIDNIDPGTFVKGWPGRLSGELVGEGLLQEGLVQHEITLHQLSGEIQGEPVQGDGKVSITGKKYIIDEIKLQRGESHVFLTGTIEEELALEMRVQSPDLSSFYPELQGKLFLDSTISGPQTTPLVKLDIDIEELKYQNVGTEKLLGSVHVDLREGGAVFFDIKGTHIRTDNLDIAELKTNINGTMENHHIEAELRSNQGELKTSATGQLANQKWKGILADLRLSSSPYGDWELSKSTEVLFSPEKVRVKEFCFKGTGGEGCLSGEWLKDSLWNVTAQVPSLSLGFLNELHLLSMSVEGQVQGFAALEGENGFPKTVKVEILVPQATIDVTPEVEGAHSIRFVENRYHLELADEILDSQVQLRTDKGSVVKGSVKIVGVNDAVEELTSLPLEGRLDVDLQELGFLSVLTDYGLRSSGSLEGAIKIDGTIGNPLAKGKMDLREGSLSIPSLGIHLEELQVALEAHGDKIHLLSTSRSKEGELSEEGVLAFGGPEGWTFTGKLKGENFLLIDLPEYEIFAEPDLVLFFNGDRGEISGEILFPRGRIAPTGGSGHISASGDVVFVDERKEARRNKWELATDIYIELGDEIQLDSFGLKSRLDGRLAVKDVPGRGMTGRGEIVVRDGTFSIYGRSLDIERGRLLFAGGPIDNPGIDVRAQRTIDETVVGVDIGGTVHDLEVNLFSNPHMEDDEILAFLVVGRSISQTSSEEEENEIGAAAASLGLLGADALVGGIGKRIPLDEIHLEGGKESEDMSIVVGKNITKDLFIGYDHNFFDSTGEFRVRYNLGRGFSVETRSSVESTSGDVLYSIER